MWLEVSAVSGAEVGGRGVRSRSGPGHLARRFFWSIRSGEVDPADDRWARSLLSAAEGRLWDSMNSLDRAHSVAVARRVARRARETATEMPEWVMTAALLHDVGKADADLPTWARVFTALLDPLVPERTAASWSRRQGTVGRIGRHLTYTEVGASMLETAGSDPRVVAWAREHHHKPSDWSVDPVHGEILAWADRGATHG